MNLPRRAEIKVSGQVQGVFFRQEVKRFAQKLGLTGRVRNEADGSVKIVAEGEEPALQKLIEWCKTVTGLAKVDRVEAEWQEAAGEFTTFVIR